MGQSLRWCSLQKWEILAWGNRNKNSKNLILIFHVKVNVTVLERLCPAETCPHYNSHLGIPISIPISNTEHGSLTSPNHPRNYPNNLSNTQTISVSNGRVIINFTKFDTESDCDKVTVRDEDGTTLLYNYSGSTLPAQIESNTNKVFITFVTDPSQTRSGWSLDWHNKI